MGWLSADDINALVHQAEFLARKCSATVYSVKQPQHSIVTNPELNAQSATPNLVKNTHRRECTPTRKPVLNTNEFKISIPSSTKEATLLTDIESKSIELLLWISLTDPLRHDYTHETSSRQVVTTPNYSEEDMNSIDFQIPWEVENIQDAVRVGKFLENLFVLRYGSLFPEPLRLGDTTCNPKINRVPKEPIPPSSSYDIFENKEHTFQALIAHLSSIIDW
eukprot:gene3816-6326_t